MKRNILVAVFAALLTVPLPTTSVPEWEINVVNEFEEPMLNARVTQEWSNSIFLGDAHDTLISDSNGQVTFPPRTFWCPLLFRVLLRILEHINSVLLHGSRIGAYSTVVCEEGRYYWLKYQSGDQLEHRLVVRTL
jgi:hypothetical protein